jgi:hypothetical protein
VKDNFDFDNTIKELGLKRPIYYELACYDGICI